MMFNSGFEISGHKDIGECKRGPIHP